jgi:tetratricopeptide (TPR) repeat protein
MGNAPEPTAVLESALQRVASLLRTDPALAAREATAILVSRPGHPLAMLFLGMARRQLDDLPGAIAVLEPLARRQPGSAAVHYELGITLGPAGRRHEALASLERAVALKPDVGEAWRLIAEHRMETGDPAGADAAWSNHVAITTAGPALLGPAAALCANRPADAERLLRAHLARHPDDPAALRMLADLAMRATRWDDAVALLERCLALAPDLAAARHGYALALHEQHRTDEALAQIERLLAGEPGNPVYLNLKANVLERAGDHAGAVEAFETVLAGHPSNPRIWMAYGDALKTAGRSDDGIAAYRRSLDLAPGFGEAWWSLANLKTYRFLPADVAIMQARLGRTDAADADRLHLHFALGKALEDEGRFAESFAHYAEGNRIRRAGIAYDAAATSEFVRRMISLYTREFVVQRQGWGCGAADPIFVVGLPRSGSTLVEQILASHSAVEATMELPDVAVLARSLADRAPYPDVLARLDDDTSAALGERYLARTRRHRRTGASRFIDKMPNNWMHAGLIHLMLPEARIIDVRRDPMACCWSCFRQHFARGQHYTYSLEDLGRYYRDYVALMAHLDEVLPGRVLRVSYERLVEDTEAEVRRMLDHCGLDFEASTLRFYEAARAVATASSEQVRRPVYREALAQWRHFEPWLGPLRDSLGPALAGERVAR